MKAPPPVALASDRRFWKATIGLPFCGSEVHLPEQWLTWSTVSTEGAYQPWKIVNNGLSLYLKVVVGCELVMIAKPRANSGPLGFGRPSLYGTPFTPIGENSELWDVEYVLLCPGTELYVYSQILTFFVSPLAISARILRPNTPHFRATLTSTITRGGYFYAMGTMVNTFVGILQAFVHGPKITNNYHVPASRQLLGRIMIGIHQICVKSDAWVDCKPIFLKPVNLL